MKHLRPIEEKKPKGAPDWHDSDAPDANGRFRDLSIKDLAAWLIKTRKKDVKRISGSLTQQIVFNRNDDPKYAEKMEKTRKEVYKQLGREDLLESKREDVGKYNTVKKVIKELGRRPSEQEVATFINNNYYDVTEVERGDDDPAANDKIADLVAFYKFDIDDWNIAWFDAQNESLVTEASKDRMIKQIERALKDGLSIFKLPMATQTYYRKNKSDFETIEEGNYKMEDIYDLIAHHRFDKDFEKLSSKDKEWVKNDAKERGFNESLLESDMFNMYYSLIDELYEAKPGPDAYMTGLSDKEKEEKEAKMKKQAEMDDDDPDSYEEMPGDKEARESGKVKKSKHTTAYNKKFKGESMKNLKSFDNFVTEKRSDIWSPYQKADILAGDMFGAMGLYRLEDDELDQIIDLKKADKLAKKMFGEFGFKTLAAKEMEDLLDNNPKLLRESMVTETNDLVDRIGDLDDILMSDRKAEREWEEMSQNYLDGQRGSEYWGDLGDQELQDAIDDAESLMKKYRIKESVVADSIRVDKVNEKILLIMKDVISKMVGAGFSYRTDPKMRDEIYDAISKVIVPILKDYGYAIKESKESDELAIAINDAIIDIDDSMSYKDFAEAVAKVIKDEYGSHLYKPFQKQIERSLKESLVNEEKIKYAKGKTYQSSGHYTVMVDSNSSMCDIRVNHSAGWRLDPHDDREETWELLDGGRQRATIYFRRGSIDKFAQQMFDLNDRTTWGNKTKLTAKDYADIIRLWMDMKKANEVKEKKSLNEAKLSVIHKAAKKGSYPAVIVVVQDGKVIHQEPVSTPEVAPATFNVMQKKYPKALLHLEDKTGKRLFSESVTERFDEYSFKFGKKSQYGVDDVNLSYGFWGTLELNMDEEQVSISWEDAFDSLVSIYKFTDEAALYYLNSKAGRHLADKFAGGEFYNLEDTMEDYANKGQWKKWAKEYAQFAEEDNMEEGLMIRESKSDMDEYYRELLEAEQTTNDQSPLGDDGMETGIKNKAKESGVPVGLLRIIMRRGLAAWKTGHRPGATQAQWGYARVNSFLTKQPGTWGKADSDIAKKVRDGGHDKNL